MRPTRNADAARSNQSCNNDVGAGAAGGGIITSDIMELISEEELSVCRSEGSPPRKPKKRKALAEDRENAAPIVDMVTGRAAVVPSSAVPSKKAKAGSSIAGKKSTRVGAGSAALSNFRLRPDRTKRLSDAGHSFLMGNDATSIPASEMREAESGITSLKAIMDRIKSHQDIDGSDKFSSDENNAGMRDDESSGGKSFSEDELSEQELRAVQGDILGAIKRFDELYNKKDSKDKYSKERTDQRKVKKL